ELSARSIGVLRFALYAGPDYLEKHGHPAEPTDLKRHRRIAYGPSGDGPWRLYRGDATATVETSPIAISDSSHMALTLAREGLGVVLLPRMLADPHVAQGRLVPILGGWSRIPVPVQAVFASSRYMAPKVRAFIDLAVAEFRGQRDEDGDTSAPPSSV
ncbi:MAG: substrate binding domain-containing protein, partial [Pseudomonadota bacterium]